MTPDTGCRTVEKAKIICPPPSGVDIIIGTIDRVVIYPTAVYASCDIGLVYPTTRSISSLVYPMAVYARSISSLVYPMAMYTRSLLVYPNFNHLFLSSFLTCSLTLSKCNNNQVILLFHSANPCKVEKF